MVKHIVDLACDGFDGETSVCLCVVRVYVREDFTPPAVDNFTLRPEGRCSIVTVLIKHVGACCLFVFLCVRARVHALSCR